MRNSIVHGISKTTSQFSTRNLSSIRFHWGGDCNHRWNVRSEVYNTVRHRKALNASIYGNCPSFSSQAASSSNVHKITVLDSLKRTTVQWLQTKDRIDDNWNPRNAAMTRHLIENWIAATKTASGGNVPPNNNNSSDLAVAVRFATVLLKHWLHSRATNPQPLPVRADGEERFARLLSPPRHQQQHQSHDASFMELFYRVLHLWQRHSHALTAAPFQAADLLRTFHSYSLDSNKNALHLQPGPRAYSMVFETFKTASTSHVDIVALQDLADPLIQQLLQQCADVSTHYSLEDAAVARNSYLHFLAHRCNLPEQVELFFREEITSSPVSTLVTIATRTKSYAAVIQAWANAGRSDKALAILDEMIRDLNAVNLVCCNICLNALGYAGKGQEAETLLCRIRGLLSQEESDGTSNTSVRLDEYSYLAVINAWAKSNQVEKAMCILEQMLLDTHVQPTSAVYTAILDAWARRPNSGPQVEAMLYRMEELYATTGKARPCSKAYTIAIRAWGTTSDNVDAPDRATAILHQMEVLSKSSPDRHDLAPCTIAYTSLIHAWAQSARSDAPHRAVRILRHLDQKYSETADSRFMPDTIVLNTVLNAFAKHGLATAARSLLNEFKGQLFTGLSQGSRLRPDSISWATVIQAFRNRRSPDSGTIAKELLLELEELYAKIGDNSMKPPASMYASVILADSLDTDAAEAEFFRMVDRYQSKLSDVSPTAIVCNALLYVWSQCDDPVAPHRAESILFWMKKESTGENALDVLPDVTSFNLVVKTWEHSKRRNKDNHVKRLELEMETRDLHIPHL